MAELKIKADSGGGTVSFKGPATTTSNAAVQLTLPVDDGTSGQYLKTDGSGALSWATVASPVTALNNATANELVTVGSTTTELDAESNLTFDGSSLHTKSGSSGQSTCVAWADDLVVEGSGDSGITILSANDKDGSLCFGDDGDADVGRVVYNHTSNFLGFDTNGTHRLKIYSSGGLGLDGASRKEGSYMINIPCDPNSPTKKGIHWDGDGAGSGQGYVAALFTHSDSAYGNITWSTSGTVYATSSDYRMKENVVNLTGAITRIKNFKPYRFNFKEDKDKTVDGFLAHEAATVVPEAVTGAKDATETRTNFVKSKAGKLLGEGITEAEWTAGKAANPAEYPADSTWGASEEVPVWQSIDQSKIVPLLTAALQEAITKIETLETKVAALEAG